MNFDPFTIFPEEINNEILPYLNAHDIKKASLVTKHWYNIIGQSKLCMGKLCLKREKCESFDSYTDILDSNRLYQHLVLIPDYDDVQKNTKYLRIMREIVTKFAKTIVSLKVSCDLIIRVNLPKLKELVYNKRFNSISIASNGLLARTKGLEVLKVKYTWMDLQSLEYVKSFLKENDSLKVLSIRDIRLVKDLNANNIKFKLDVFKPRLFYYSEELLTFLSAHKSTLKVTKTTFSIKYLTFLLSNCPQLHTLTIRNYNYNKDHIEYPFNATLKNLKLDIPMHMHHSIVTDIVKKLNVLEHVEIGNINSEILHALFSCRSLKTVKYGKLNVPKIDQNKIIIQDNIKFVAL